MRDNNGPKRTNPQIAPIQYRPPKLRQEFLRAESKTYSIPQTQIVDAAVGVLMSLPDGIRGDIIWKTRTLTPAELWELIEGACNGN